MIDWTPGEIATFRADLQRIRKTMRAADVLIASIVAALEDAILEQGHDPMELRATISAPLHAKVEAEIDRKVKAHASKRTRRRAARRAKAAAAKAGTLPPPKIWVPRD